MSVVLQKSKKFKQLAQSSDIPLIDVHVNTDILCGHLCQLQDATN